MKSIIKYTLLLIIGLLSTLTAKSQTVNDVGIVWETETTMPQSPGYNGIINTIGLANGNYLMWGRGMSNDLASDDLLLYEYTETGSIIRQQIVKIPTPGTNGKTRISHPRIIELPNNRLLALIEFNDGSAGGLLEKNILTRVTLTPDASSGHGGGSGWQANVGLHGYEFVNHSVYQIVHVIRTLVLVRVAENLIAVAFTGVVYPDINNPNARGVVGGILYIDNDGEVSTDSRLGSTRNDALKIISKSGAAMTGLIKNNGKLTLSAHDGINSLTDNIYADNITNFEGAGLVCLDCVALRDARIMPFNDKYIGIDQTAMHIPPNYYDGSFQITGWKWDINGAIQRSPNPFFRRENTALIGNFIKINESTIFSTVRSGCDRGDNVICGPIRIAQFTITDKIEYEEALEELESKLSSGLGLYIHSNQQDGLMAAGSSLKNPRLVVSKISLCKSYFLSDLANVTVQSNIATEIRSYTSNGAFPGATQEYSWRAILRGGQLGGSHAAATVDTVLETGTGATISALTFVALNNEEAIIEVEYIAKQTYGSPVSHCSTAKSYNIRVLPDIKENQNICSGNTPAPLTGIAVDNATYQWQQSLDDGATWTNAVGTSTTQNYTPPALTAETQYRRVVTVPSEGSATSNAVTIQIYQLGSIDVVAMPTATKDGSGTLIIKTSLKNIGLASFANPFHITVYKDAVGDATKHTYVYSTAITRNETVDFEITISNFDSQFAGATLSLSTSTIAGTAPEIRQNVTKR